MPKPYRRRRFPQRYTREDIELLAGVDEAHEVLSGPATQKILQRAYYDFQVLPYQRLAELSVAQLYRLRQSRTYRQRRTAYQATRPTKVASGVGRNQTGDRGICRWIRYIRGLWRELKGFTTSTPWMRSYNGRRWGATEQISEAYLLPVVEAMLAQLPFGIRGFRPRHSNDNGWRRRRME